VGTIRATGLNYTDHASELGMALPTVPSLFFKPAEALAHPGEAIPIPPCAQNDEVDYEVELAIVIGRPCRNVSADEALDYVLGWTCANDLTARRLQEQCSQWGYSKGKLANVRSDV
jgi:2-keto-4-pentenoate hydratase/2-oxohepta-3-ene-1,7-dioic acid hydratase in catechol pathway